MNAASTFLPPLESEGGIIFRSPLRCDGQVESYISGKETLKQIELAIFNAKKSIYIAYWLFNPNLRISHWKVRNALKKRSKSPKWLDLIKLKASKVDIRIIINDLDANVYANRHYLNWSSYRKFYGIAKDVAKKKDSKPFEVICTLHPHELKFNKYFAKSFGDDAEEVLKFLTSQNKDSRKVYNEIMSERFTSRKARNCPQLWRNLAAIERKNKGPIFKYEKVSGMSFFPISYHQKITIVDGEIAFCGGVDPLSGRLGSAWWDVHCKVTGLAAADIERNFIERWNMEIGLFQLFVKRSNKALHKFPSRVRSDFHIRMFAPTKIKKIYNTDVCSSENVGTLTQIHRTASISSVDDYFSWINLTVIDDIEQIYMLLKLQKNIFS